MMDRIIIEMRLRPYYNKMYCSGCIHCKRNFHSIVLKGNVRYCSKKITDTRANSIANNCKYFTRRKGMKTCGNCMHSDEPNQFRSLVFCNRCMVDVNQHTLADNCNDYSKESHDEKKEEDSQKEK